MSESDSSTPSSQLPSEPFETVDITDEFAEPEVKRRKKLEHRLGGILCCAVCLNLPRATVYQCSNGHLICAGCFTHVLADARLQDEAARCLNCQAKIGEETAARNLAVENAISELPAECQFCNKEFPRKTLETHKETECEERILGCKYSRIGCPWWGPVHKSKQHELECAHPHRSGAEIMAALQVINQQNALERKLFDSIFELLDFENISSNDLQLKLYRSEECFLNLFYETSRFSAFNKQWVVKARINNMQNDPTQSPECEMTYQLILKTKATVRLSMYFVVLRGPLGDMKVQPRIHKFDFNEQETESPYVPLALGDTADYNLLLASNTINFRLLLFLASE